MKAVVEKKGSRVDWLRHRCKFWAWISTWCTYWHVLYAHGVTYTHRHTHKPTHTDSAVWLINSFLCWGGVMTADSSQSPEDQRVTPLIKWARWNVKHWRSLSPSVSFFLSLPPWFPLFSLLISRFSAAHCCSLLRINLITFSPLSVIHHCCY